MRDPNELLIPEKIKEYRKRILSNLSDMVGDYTKPIIDRLEVIRKLEEVLDNPEYHEPTMNTTVKQPPT